MSPGARVTEVTGLLEVEVQVRVAALPVDGKANREMLQFLARALHVPRRHLLLERGAGSRHKVVSVEGLDLPEIMRRLGGLDTDLPREGGHSG